MKQILYFTASWCGPCKAMAPVITELSGRLPIQKIDVDSNKEALSTYNVRQVPTFIFLKDGREVVRKSGMTSKMELEALASRL